MRTWSEMKFTARIGTGICSLAFFILSTSAAYSQATLKGPQGPPPKLSSITYDRTPNEGWVGRSGGIQYTLTNITLANTTTVYWAILPDSVKLSMDGSSYDSTEVLAFDTAASSLEAGIAVWKGATFIPIEGGDPLHLLSEFIVTVTDQDDNPVPLTDAVDVNLPFNTGGIVEVTGSTMTFKVRVEMLVSDNDGASFVPHLDYYDAAQTPPEAISAYSSYTMGFYWENDPPALENFLPLNINEGDTAIINSSILKVTDVESDPGEIFFIIDPEGTGSLPLHVKWAKSGTDLAPGDTFTMEDINNGIIAFIHDGSESTGDTIPIMIADGDGATCRNGADSVFVFTVHVTPADDIPTLAVNEGLTLNEGESAEIGRDMLATTDPESNDTLVTYTLDPSGESEAPAHGLLKLNGIPLSDGDTFTQADINNGKLSYQHDGTGTVLDDFVFQVADEFGHLAESGGNPVFTFGIRINLVNDAPIVMANEGMTLEEGGSSVFDGDMLQATDEESAAPGIVFTLDPSGSSDYPGHGILKLNGTPLGDGDTFTQNEINDGKLAYYHDGTESALDGFVFSVSDESGGMASDNDNQIFFFEVAIQTVNDPPVLFRNLPLEVHQGSEIAISNEFLAVTDEESEAGELTFTLDPDHNVEQPASGVVKLNGTILDDGQTFTMADIDDGKVTYAQNGSAATSDFFVFTAEDSDGSLVSDAGFTLFHFNLVISLPDDLMDPKGKDKSLFTAYPNPVHDDLGLTFREEVQGPVTLTLMNLMGEKIRVNRIEAGPEVILPFADFPAGLYYLEVRSGTMVQSVKILKK